MADLELQELLRRFKAEPGDAENLKRLVARTIRAGVSSEHVDKVEKLLDLAGIEGYGGFMETFREKYLAVKYDELKDRELKGLLMRHPRVYLMVERPNQVKPSDRRSIVRLRVHRPEVSHIAQLARFPNLTRLVISHIKDGPFRYEHAERIARTLPNLEHLGIANHDIGSLGATYLAKMPNLESLDLSNNAISRTGLESLLKMPKLKALEANQSAFSHTGRFPRADRPSPVETALIKERFERKGVKAEIRYD